jgi:hypothetical protein
MTATAQLSKLAELNAKTDRELVSLIDKALELGCCWQRMNPMLTLRAYCIAERRIVTLIW